MARFSSSSFPPLRAVLLGGGLSVVLLLLALSSSSTRSGRFTLLPASYYRLSTPPATFLVPPSAPYAGAHPTLPLLPSGARPAAAHEQQRLAQLERIEALDHALGGFATVGFLGPENARQVERLRQCLEEGRWGGRCGPEGEGVKVVLVGYKYFACALTDDLDPEDKLNCHNAGETIWMRSMLESFRRSGVFYLNAQPDHLGELYGWFGDIITHVWAEDGQLLSCLSDAGCVASPENPTGIPPWKLFATTWWGHPAHTVLTDHGLWNVPQDETRKGWWSWNPLGSEWTLSPYEMPDNVTFLGYNIIGCDDIPVLPADARQDAILLLAKKTSYFVRPEAWPLTLYAELARDTGLDIISSAKEEVVDGVVLTLPEGVQPHERMGRVEYEEFVGEMKVLLGIGNPGTSPSPYNALCQGVPVVLPYSSPTPTPSGWDLFNSSLVQHGPAALLGEPYIYSLSLSASPAEAAATIRRAASTPIDRFVPASMTAESVDRRVLSFLAVDWERVARGKQGLKVGEPLRPVEVGDGMLQECRRRGFCTDPDADGLNARPH